MRRHVFKRGDWKDRWDKDAVKGTYIPKIMDGKQSALLCCPDCGCIAGIDSHTIVENGEVNPSVVCDNEDCEFHAFVAFKDWGKPYEKKVCKHQWISLGIQSDVKNVAPKNIYWCESCGAHKYAFDADEPLEVIYPTEEYRK